MPISAYHTAAQLSVSTFTAPVLVCLVALGMALAFIAADPESATSRALAVAFALIGITIDLNIVVGLQYNLPLRITRWFAITDAAAIIALLEWVLRVRRTIPAGTFNTRGGDLAIRLGQLCGVAYAVLSIALPEMRESEFIGGLIKPGAIYKWEFWIFVLPIALAGFSAVMSMVLLLNRKPDRPERVRIIAMIVAIPFMSMSFVLGVELASIAMIIGEMIFLVGAVEYHVLQGQRGQFMSRFLSPQVAKLVSERGLASAMQENHLEITVVCCDLRGFTAYAQEHASQKVLGVLREYYDAVGGIVAEFGATIKDFAGDGVLILVGAPLPQPQHAPMGIHLSHKVRAAVREVTARACAGKRSLGVGVGVASGFVTVGVIGSSGRFEYTAVGPAVNLASRLCEMARDGEVLVSADTIARCEDRRATLEARAPVEVKGYAEPVPHFNLRDEVVLASAA
jgi:adenylate cyclase